MGNNIITMCIVKKVCPAILPHLTHLNNALIITEIYPSILKISCITLFLKPDKLSELIHNYMIGYNLGWVADLEFSFKGGRLADGILEIY